MLQVGGRKKNKGKKPKVKDATVEEAFNIDIQIITKFSLVNVSPPMSPDDLDKKIEELKKKREAYIDEGQKKLDEEAEKLASMDPDNYEEENLRGEEHDDEYRERKSGYRGRGGRGRGGRGGREYRSYREKQDYVVEEEEEEKQYIPTKAPAKR